MENVTSFILLRLKSKKTFNLRCSVKPYGKLDHVYMHFQKKKFKVQGKSMLIVRAINMKKRNTCN